jgi:hypothetical protein
MVVAGKAARLASVPMPKAALRFSLLKFFKKIVLVRLLPCGFFGFAREVDLLEFFQHTHSSSVVMG